MKMFRLQLKGRPRHQDNSRALLLVQRIRRGRLLIAHLTDGIGTRAGLGWSMDSVGDQLSSLRLLVVMMEMGRGTMLVIDLVLRT